MSLERWTGAYFDGLTAHRRVVTLSAEHTGLRLAFDDGAIVVWPYDVLRQTQGRFPGEQLRIEAGTNPVQSVLVNEPGLVEAIHRVSPRSRRTLRERRATVRVVAGALTLLAAMIAGYLWGAPIMAAWMAPRLPPTWEVAMGRSVAEGVAAREEVCGDSASLATLRGIFARLLAPDSASPYEFTLTVLRDTSVNAFAAPGGFIMVHSGLVAASRTPEEFAGVAAHEIEHVTLRHSTRSMIREMPLRYALASISGSGGVDAVASLAGSLGVLRYRRNDESEADRQGMRRLVAAGVDPSGMVEFMRRLESSRGELPAFANYLSSHPSASSRAAQLETLAAERGEVRPLVDSATWSRARKICQE